MGGKDAGISMITVSKQLIVSLMNYASQNSNIRYDNFVSFLQGQQHKSNPMLEKEKEKHIKYQSFLLTTVIHTSTLKKKWWLKELLNRLVAYLSIGETQRKGKVNSTYTDYYEQSNVTFSSYIESYNIRSIATINIELTQNHFRLPHFYFILIIIRRIFYEIVQYTILLQKTPYLSFNIAK